MKASTPTLLEASYRPGFSFDGHRVGVQKQISMNDTQIPTLIKKTYESIKIHKSS